MLANPFHHLHTIAPMLSHCQMPNVTSQLVMGQTPTAKRGVPGLQEARTQALYPLPHTLP